MTVWCWYPLQAKRAKLADRMAIPTSMWLGPHLADFRVSELVTVNDRMGRASLEKLFLPLPTHATPATLPATAPEPEITFPAPRSRTRLAALQPREKFAVHHDRQ